MPLTEPWSKKHKQVTRAGASGMAHSLSNSYAQPLTHGQLMELTRQRGDHALIAAYNDHNLGYTPNGGSLDLREQIAALYGEKITAAHVLVFPGAQVALQTAALALTNAHTHAIVFDPAYQSTQEAPVHAGSQVTRVRLRADEGWQVDPDAVEAAMREHTSYLVLNEPYNPAGTLMSRAVQARLVAAAAARGVYILCDEIYRGLEHDPADRLPPMAELYEKGVSVGALSKPWGGCGITIGWLAFQDLAIKQRLVDVQYFGTASPSRASELQALMVLRASDTILQKNLALIRRNLSLLSAFMARHADLFAWVRPTAGAIAFLRFKGPLTTQALGAALAEAGIGLKPAYCFTDVVTPETDYFRVGYGEAAFPQALAALEAYVERHRHAWLEGRSRL